MSHVFFTSYARQDNDDTRVTQAVEALAKRVRAMLGVRVDPNRIAFFDATDIRTGTEWETILGDALRSIRVLVCICSPTYLNSEYCAKEFEVFRQRVTDAQAAMQGKVAIIPVIWERGAPPMALPDVIARFQYQDDRFPKGYAVHGLSRLARFESQKIPYEETIEVLAEVVGAAYANSALPTWATPVKFDTLPRWFHNPERGPYNLATLVLHRDGTQWRPDDGLRSVGSIIDNVATSLNIAWREIPLGITLQDQLDAVVRDRHVAVVVVDADSMNAAPMDQYLTAIDKAARPNCAVLVGFPDSGTGGATGAAGAEASLRTLLPESSKVVSWHQAFQQRDPKTLQDALTRAVTAVRMALVKADPPQKVENPALSDAAMVAGVPIDSRPTLSGSIAKTP